MLAGNHKPASPLFAKKNRKRQKTRSGLAFAALAATPVPVPPGARIDMDETGFAIGAYAAAIGQGADIFRESPFGHTRYPDVRCLATHMLGALGAAYAAVIGRRAVSRRDDRLLAELPFNPVQQRDQFRLETLDPDLGVFRHQSAL